MGELGYRIAALRANSNSLATLVMTIFGSPTLRLDSDSVRRRRDSV